MIEYGDFHCPFCRQYARETWPEVRKHYVDPGKVLYAFRHFPLQIHPRAPEAAVAALCAARQGRFWELHDRFFRAPRPVAPEELEGHVRAVGADLQKFRTCTRAGVAREDVRLDVEEARRLGLAGTPGLAFGVRDGDERVRVLLSLSGAQPYATIAAILDKLLAGRPTRP
jgi:protein-disulfide isomerase